jgi:tripartite-type tricarboxylate transporter receptor subunit TctC
VPTFDEASLKGFYTDNWYGLVAPANTPRPILEKLNNALIKALENPQVRQSFIEQGAFPAIPMTVDQYWSFVKDQMPVAAEMVKLTGAKME